MPWTVARAEECPASKPWAVIRDSNGAIEGCHPSEAAAMRQRAALYAQENANQMSEHKSFPVETKADGDAGEFVALASVFNNVDLVGDRILPGAFSKTLADFRASGNPIPVVFDHQHDNIKAYIGKVDPNDVEETKVGLEVRGKLDIEDDDFAKRTFQLMKDRVLRAWSFAYTVPKGGQKRTKDANEISEIDLIEVGPTLKGANPEALLQGVKSALEEKGAEVEAGIVSESTYSSPEITEAPATTAEVEDLGLRTVPDGKAERQDPPEKPNDDWTETEKWFLEVFAKEG